MNVTNDQLISVCGHRGLPSRFPENSTKGFVEAAKSGISGIEMDVVVSKNEEVILSHEPWFAHRICETPEGADYGNIFQCETEKVQSVNCGKIPLAEVPGRKPDFTPKPLLSDVIKAVEAVDRGSEPPVEYFIELKSSPEVEFIYVPEHRRFADLVVQTALEHAPAERINIQSFDFRVLRHVKARYPQVACVLLTETEGSPEEKIMELGFIPKMYGCRHDLIDDSGSEYLKENGIKLIPWTVNDPDSAIRLIELGAHTLITDFPEQMMKLLKAEKA